MRKLIIANWKMNPAGQAMAKRLFAGIVSGVRGVYNADVVICPPFIYLSGLDSKKVKLGAQDIFWADKGAYTGEVSGKMLKSLGVKYVIVGHSERRAHLGETDEMINKKIKAALKLGLKPIFCVGEKQRKNNDYYVFVKNQIKAGLAKVPKKLSKNIIIAYEPVWAIGTGKAVKPQDLFEMATYIRRVVFNIFGKKTAYKMPILYGGSVNAKNAAKFLNVEGVNGFLVGGASLNAKEFTKIVKEAAND